MEEGLLQIAKESPVLAILGYLVWRMTSQQQTMTDAFQSATEGFRQNAEVLREIRIQWDADRRMLEELHRQTAVKLEELRREVQALQR